MHTRTRALAVAQCLPVNTVQSEPAPRRSAGQSGSRTLDALPETGKSPGRPAGSVPPAGFVVGANHGALRRGSGGESTGGDRRVVVVGASRSGFRPSGVVVVGASRSGFRPSPEAAFCPKPAPGVCARGRNQGGLRRTGSMIWLAKLKGLETATVVTCGNQAKGQVHTRTRALAVAQCLPVNTVQSEPAPDAQRVSREVGTLCGVRA